MIVVSRLEVMLEVGVVKDTVIFVVLKIVTVATLDDELVVLIAEVGVEGIDVVVVRATFVVATGGNGEPATLVVAVAVAADVDVVVIAGEEVLVVAAVVVEALSVECETLAVPVLVVVAAMTDVLVVVRAA